MTYMGHLMKQHVKYVLEADSAAMLDSGRAATVWRRLGFVAILIHREIKSYLTVPVVSIATHQYYLPYQCKISRPD